MNEHPTCAAAYSSMLVFGIRGVKRERVLGRVLPGDMASLNNSFAIMFSSFKYLGFDYGGLRSSVVASDDT